MKKLKVMVGPFCFSALVSISISQANAQQDNKVIYGSDNRVEVVDYSDELFQQKAKSVAAMVSTSELEKKRAGARSYYTYDYTQTLEERVKVCSHERFSQQPALANCTGFLVGDDLLVTAGHCVEDQKACDSFKWVFGYENGVKTFDKQDVYSCKEVLDSANALGLFSHKDYSVLKLDRKVQNRRPLEYRTSGRVSRGDKLVVIGHPSGLPMKIADNAEVRRHRINFFYANLDTYSGNSGSPVFSSETGKVEGILIRSRAGSDYRETNDGCRVSRIVERRRAREMVHRITRVSEIQ